MVQWQVGDSLPDPEAAIARISTDWDSKGSWAEQFRAFLALPGVERVRGLVVGMWAGDDV